jgi:hypothetical protein
LANSTRTFRCSIERTARNRKIHYIRKRVPYTPPLFILTKRRWQNQSKRSRHVHKIKDVLRSKENVLTINVRFNFNHFFGDFIRIRKLRGIIGKSLQFLPHTILHGKKSETKPKKITTRFAYNHADDRETLLPPFVRDNSHIENETKVLPLTREESRPEFTIPARSKSKLGNLKREILAGESAICSKGSRVEHRRA